MSCLRRSYETQGNSLAIQLRMSDYRFAEEHQSGMRSTSNSSSFVCSQNMAGALLGLRTERWK